MGSHRRIHRSSDRIHHRDANIALTLRDSRNGGELELLGDAAEAFVIGEKEELVALDGAANRKSELVLDQHGLHVVGRLEESDGVEIGISEVLVDGSVILVRASA